MIESTPYIYIYLAIQSLFLGLIILQLDSSRTGLPSLQDRSFPVLPVSLTLRTRVKKMNMSLSLQTEQIFGYISPQKLYLVAKTSPAGSSNVVSHCVSLSTM